MTTSGRKAIVNNEILEKLLQMENSELYANFINLPDDQFSKVAPIVTDALKEELNKPESKLAIAQAIQAANMAIEDLEKAITEIKDTSAEKLGLSEVKKVFLLEELLMIYNAYSEYEGKIKYNIQIPTKKDSEAQMPSYQTDGAAGADVYALEDVTIDPGETKIIPTGLKMEIPKGYAILVQMRSGLAAKTKLRLANGVGLIDSRVAYQ